MILHRALSELLAEGTRNGLTKPKRIRGTGVKMIGMGEIFANSRIGNIEMERVPVTNKELENYCVQPNDLLFARQSLKLEGAGKCSIIVAVNEPTVFESHLIRVRIDESVANPVFVYYFFNSPFGHKYIMTIVEQVAAAGLRASDLVKLKVPCPNIEIQNKSAYLLKMIDDKIALNQQINKNLEEQAQAIYKAWFVDFEPWQGERPNSWEEGVLGDYVEIKRGGSPRPIQDYLVDSGLRWLKISDVTALQSPFIIDIKEHIKVDGLNKTVFLKAGALVLSNSATPGIPKILDVDSCIHDGWLYFPKSKLSNEFLYLLFKFIRKDLVQLGNGSVFTNLKTDILKNYPFSMPANNTLSMFDDIVTPLFQSMNNIARENKRLSNLRDALLPRLMSGEIDVSRVAKLGGWEDKINATS